MKKGFVLQSLICLLAVSCSVQEIDTNDPVLAEDDVFYASLESDSKPDTKVYLDMIDEKPKILWDAEDQISIFNKSTLNQQYEFLGNTGDNAGYFKRVTEGTETEANGGYVCAVYPYQESTSLDDTGVLTLTLPEKQTYYRENSFGLGANTMVSTTDGQNNLLRFKNVGGYLVLKFYGVDGDNAISIKSIKLEGRNGELLSGKATMTPVIDGLPEIEMAPTAGTSITLKCDKAVKLGKTEKNATLFWIVVPSTDFTQGLILTVTDKNDRVFVKETDMHLTVERNTVLRIKAIEVKPALPLDPDKVIYYTTSDKNVVVPTEGAAFGANVVSNDYVDLKGILAFDGSVTGIGAHAFEGSETLTGMTIPSSVTSIGDFAFAGCTSLGAPNTPSGADITEPTKGPNRSGETTFVIPEGVTSIGAHAFENCTSLTSIIIPDSVTSIGDGAFQGCTNLTDIDIPDTVEDMGENVFNGCTGITSVTIPYGVTSIDDYAFAGCSNLVSIDIPETVTSIGKHAFDDCENLVSITIPAGVTKIEDFAFAACMELPRINIPDGVTSIGASAFESCFKLADVELPSSVESIGNYAFASCHEFTTFTIPSNVTRISDGLFYSCYQLGNVFIHNDVESIGYGAFYQCQSLTSIILPSSVTCIEDQVFHGCTGLISITIEAINPPVTEYGMEYTFVDTNDCPVYVPAGSVDAYREADGWSQYASRIYSIGTQTGTINDHAYVDLGTGAKWATMNVGATSSVAPGVILPWSEGKTAAEDWGGSWRLPTREELSILTDESKFTWTLDSENNGFIITSKMAGYVGNSIFLPFADASDPSDPDWNLPGTGFFWSSTLAEGGFYYYLQIDDADVPFVGGGNHSLCFSIRPVAD